MVEERKYTRYKTIARARIPALFEGESLLKDISVTGCCIECTMQVDVRPETKYAVVIEPEASSQIGPFELMAEYRWNRSGSDACLIGFLIVESPKGRQLQA